MKSKLDDLLCQRYPDLFSERQMPMEKSCMGRGFTCGDGWFDLIDTLCSTIRFNVEHGEMPSVVVKQVKEKFGTLRFYFRGGDDRTAGMVCMAEAMSAHLCEKCGARGELLGGMARCPDHFPVEMSADQGSYAKRIQDSSK